jgi:C1A family cysteine protease
MRHFLAAAPAPDRADHRAEMPAVFDQGQVGTCVACASAYYDKTFQEQLENAWGMRPMAHRFSPMFIYSQRSDTSSDGGMTIREAMKIINQQGVCTLADMPYAEDAINVPPPTRTGWVPMPTRGDPFVGGHALCFVGFDRSKELLFFANSWGPAWGESGFGSIGYDVFAALLMDAWGMVDAPDSPQARRRRKSD